MIVAFFKAEGETPASPTLGIIGLVLILVSLTTASLLKLGQWIPTIMFGLAIVLFTMGILGGKPSYEGLAVMIAVVLATGVAFASEAKSDREFEILNAQKDSLRVKVERDGATHTVPLEEVVVGDLVLLEMGDEVPADGRVVKANELYIDQSLMTGEAEPVRKLVTTNEDDPTDGPDQAACVYRGTQVVDGAGRMLVADVGDASMIGQIAKRLSSDGDDEDESADKPLTPEERIQKKLTISKELTPLQLKLAKLADQISTVGKIAAIAIFFAMIVLGIVNGKITWPGEGQEFGTVMIGNLSALLDAFVYMVIIIVVAVPEGLPMSVTVSLALAMQKMTRANSLVRQLVACETIGSATVICSDKTGTLTQNKMSVVRIGFDGNVYERDKNWPKPGNLSGTPSGPLDWIALNSAVNSTANLEEKEGRIVAIGNSTEGSLINYLRDNGIDYNKIRDANPVLYQIHFSSDRKRMTTVIKLGGELVVFVKGASEVILEQCKHFQTSDGHASDITPEFREKVMAQIQAAAGEAMRTLSFAYAKLPGDFPTDEDSIHARRDELEKRLVFVGFVAIRDPLRDDVKDAVRECRDAGIEVKMITGDNIETARSIAKEIGLLDDPKSLTLTSAEFNAMSDDEVKAKVHDIRVLARARPLDKFRMVKILQEQSEVVAVTGDGTNDAPALKKADVGLAMGIAGTEVAKEASKIVLLDDAFSTIVKAVHWGRSLYENIQRFIQFQLTINVSALTIAFLGPFLGVQPPFTVLQLLWINVIMDTFAAIALCSEPPRSGLMRARPKRRDESIITPGMLKNILVTAVFFIIVMITLLLGMKHGEWFKGTGTMSETFEGLSIRQVSIFFSVYVFFQVWNLINCRSLTPETSGLKNLFTNFTFLMITSIIVIVQVLIVSIPFLASIFRIEPLSAMDWLIIAASTSTVLVFVEISRRIRMAMKTG